MDQTDNLPRYATVINLVNNNNRRLCGIIYAICCILFTIMHYTHYGAHCSRGGDCSWQRTWHRRHMRLCGIIYELCCFIFTIMYCTLNGYRRVRGTQCSALCHDETHAAFARHTVSLCSSVKKGTEVVHCLWNCYAGCVPMGIANPPRLRAVVPRRLLPRLMDAGPQMANIMERGIRQVVPRSLRAEVALEGANLHSIP